MPTIGYQINKYLKIMKTSVYMYMEKQGLSLCSYMEHIIKEIFKSN
jgi:hypothetical protein